MKRSFLFFIFLIGLILLISFIFPDRIFTMGRKEKKVFSTQLQGQILDVNIDEPFQIVLPNPGAGGYLVSDPEFDPNILILLKMEKKPPLEPKKSGDFGIIEWTFKAREEGISKILIRAFRPWEKGKESIILFEAQVRVKK